MIDLVRPSTYPAALQAVDEQILLAGRQGQAITTILMEVRRHLTIVDAKGFVTDSFENAAISGEKRCAAVIAAILERHGLA